MLCVVRVNRVYPRPFPGWARVNPEPAPSAVRHPLKGERTDGRKPGASVRALKAGRTGAARTDARLTFGTPSGAWIGGSGSSSHRNLRNYGRKAEPETGFRQGKSRAKEGGFWGVWRGRYWRSYSELDSESARFSKLGLLETPDFQGLGRNTVRGGFEPPVPFRSTAL